MAKYRSKQRVIEAEQFWPDKPLPFRDRGTYVSYADGKWWVTTAHTTPTSHGQNVELMPGDWVIPEPTGPHVVAFAAYPVKPDIFEATYEEDMDMTVTNAGGERVTQQDAYERCGPITHEEASRIALKFINQHFRNPGTDRPRTSIPADPTRDDDLRLMAYIRQQQKLTPPPDPSRAVVEAASGVGLITAERARQVAKEGWTPEHDDEHDQDQLRLAAICYLRDPVHRPSDGPPVLWPWSPAWWKPTPDDRIRELVKAGALIAAEIDRLQRLATYDAAANGGKA